MRKLYGLAAVLVAGCSSSSPDATRTADNSFVVTASGPPAVSIEDAQDDVRAPSGAKWAEVRGRAAHTATTLPDGRILVAGGCVTDGCGEASDATFIVSGDAATVTVGPTMSGPRDAHTATALADGRVMLVGGYPGEGAGVLASVDIIDPVSGVLDRQTPLSQPRGGHAAALTSDGAVLVVGGWVRSRTYTASAEMVDPASGETLQVGRAPYSADALDAVTLQDGRILITGGQVAPGQATSTAAVFAPDTGSWVRVGDMTTPRLKHFSVLLGDGRVLVMGGTPDDEELLNSTELFDPIANTFSPGPRMTEPRYKFPGGAVVLDDGRVVVAGGGQTTEVLDLDAGTSTVIAQADVRGSFATLNRLDSGDLLIIGGYDDQIRLRNEVYIIPVPPI